MDAEDAPLYDEFGNYIGPDLGDGEGVSGEEEDDSEFDDEDAFAGEARPAAGPPAAEEEEDEEAAAAAGAPPSAQRALVVQAEDKRYYEDADEIYGPDAEVRVEEEDTQPLETPILAAAKGRRFERTERERPETTFDYRFLAALMDTPSLARSVVVAGHLGAGKTSLVSLLVRQTHPGLAEARYTDTREDEQSRGMSLKAVPVSLVMPDLRGKSYLLNLLDAPGHPDFGGEVVAAARVADGMVVVCDAVEGVAGQTRRALRLAVRERLAVCLVVAKVDRLLLELKLPPRDAYQKLLHTVEEANRVLLAAGGAEPLAPGAGNVCFAAAEHGWCFSLPSFARAYADRSPGGALDAAGASRFARRLWGDSWMDPRTRRFARRPPGGDPAAARAFVRFVMEPLHKLYAHVLGREGAGLRELCASVGVPLSRDEAGLNPAPLLRLVLSRFFGPAACVAEMLARHVPPPPEAAPERVRLAYQGDPTRGAGLDMSRCDAAAPAAVMHVARLVPRPDASRFDSFGRVMCGTLRRGDRVRVLGESYSPEDEEDMAVREVTRLWVWQGRYRVEVNRVTAGNWALVEGVEGSVRKTATLVADRPEADREGGTRAFRPLRFDSEAAVRVALEPANPADLPKVVEGLRSVDRSYPMLQTRVEESGEHVVVGCGEMHLDCVLHDLRRMYSEAEIKVADPLATFREAVAEPSSTPCFADTPNGRNRLTVVAEPLAPGLAAELAAGDVHAGLDEAELAGVLRNRHGWDALAARSVWAFGPDAAGGPNLLLDDTLPSNADKRLLGLVRGSLAQGFQWAAREGPLCDEPMHGVAFKLIGAEVAEAPLDRPAGQVIPTARRAAYGAFLLAQPRLLEPVYRLEVTAPAECVPLVHKVLGRRRGHVRRADPLPGTPLFVLEAYAPVMDSFGLETDIRTVTSGAAFCTSQFHAYAEVPGDPLDANVALRPLEPAPPAALARDFMVKTRRRKGLSEDVSVTKYFSEDMVLALAREDAELQEYFDGAADGNAEA